MGRDQDEFPVNPFRNRPDKVYPVITLARDYLIGKANECPACHYVRARDMPSYRGQSRAFWKFRELTAQETLDKYGKLCTPDKRIILSGVFFWRKTCTVNVPRFHFHLKCPKCHCKWVCPLLSDDMEYNNTEAMCRQA